MGEAALLNGRYRLLRALGTGGAGHTWLAEDTATGGQVTVKELHEPVVGSEDTLVQREARLLGQIDHPQVPRFVDAFVEEVRLVRRLHLVLAFVDGEPLDQVLARRRFSQVEAVAVLEDVLGVVAALHGLAPPVIHRDLKPSNIIVRPDGSVALIDFGLAIDAVDRTFQHTMAAGTLGYQAPEQIAGDPRPASDVYSVGVLAIALLTQQAPHTLLEWQTLHWEGATRHLDPALRSWLAGALDPDPDARYRDGAAALRALRQRGRSPYTHATSVDVALPSAATPSASASPPVLPTSVLRVPALIVLTTLAVALGIGVVGVLGQTGEPPLPARRPAAITQPPIAPTPPPAIRRPVPTPAAPPPAPPSEAAACRAGSGPDCLQAASALLTVAPGDQPRSSDEHLAHDLLAIGCMGEHSDSCVLLAERVEATEGVEAAARWWADACRLGSVPACGRATPHPSAE